MAITTLTDVKSHAGETGTTNDTLYSFAIRSASDRLLKYLGTVIPQAISGISKTSPAVVTCIGHGLQDGDTIVISNSDSGVSIDGEQTAAYLTEDTFSVAVDNSSGDEGENGIFVKKVTQYYNGNNQSAFQLKHRPVRSVSALYFDADGYYGQGTDAFSSDDLLTAGTDYYLDIDQDDGTSRSGMVWKASGTWYGRVRSYQGMLLGRTVDGTGNIKATYTPGFLTIPYPVRAAVNRMAISVFAKRASSGTFKTESLDFYSYTRMTAEEEAHELDSVKSLVAPYKAWTF